MKDGQLTSSFLSVDFVRAVLVWHRDLGSFFVHFRRSVYGFLSENALSLSFSVGHNTSESCGRIYQSSGSFAQIELSHSCPCPAPTLSIPRPRSYAVKLCKLTERFLANLPNPLDIFQVCPIVRLNSIIKEGGRGGERAAAAVNITGGGGGGEIDD